MNHLEDPAILKSILKTAYWFGDNPIYVATMSAHLKKAYSQNKVPSTLNPANIWT